MVLLQPIYLFPPRHQSLTFQSVSFTLFLSVRGACRARLNQVVYTRYNSSLGFLSNAINRFSSRNIKLMGTRLPETKNGTTRPRNRFLLPN